MCLEDLINYFAQPEDDMGKLGRLHFELKDKDINKGTKYQQM